MKAGDPLEFLAYLYDNTGSALSYADAAAFVADGFAVAFTVDTVATVPVYTVSDLGNGLHSFTFTAAEGDYRILMTVPGTHIASVSEWIAYIDSVDVSDLYAALNSGTELTPITQSLGDQSIGNIIDGDAFATGSITVPLSRLAPFGLSDLTGCTITGAFRKDPSATPILITASIDDAANRIISAKFDTFPVAMALDGTATDTSQVWYLDLQIIHTATSRKITVARYTVTVLWERDAS